ncbi:MAG: phosphoglycerate kinase [Candidatus Paceibacterota bacterium]|jgi:3-phosphoglycerate kinase
MDIIRYLRTASIAYRAHPVVLVRLDLNIAARELRHSVRLKRVASTIVFLRRKGCVVVIISHRGRPSKKEQQLKKATRATSLKPLVGALSVALKTKIIFEASSDFTGVARRVRALMPGSVMLLENIRLWPEEEKNNVAFAKKIATIGDIYVNDAFAVSHRAHASVDAITRFLPSYAGFELEKEIRALDAVVHAPARPLVVVLGGVKISDKIGVIKNFWKHADAIVTGGGVANTILAFRGIPVGQSVFERDALTVVRPYLGAEKLRAPIDVITAKEGIFDIGPKTIAVYSNLLQKAKTIIWNGPMGYIEKKVYQKGTLEIGRACARSKGFSVVGGGETTSFLFEKKLANRISFVSTGGGAMLDYLAGEKLPGIEALKKSIRQS